MASGFVRYNDYTQELKQTIKMQKALIDAANNIVVMQQRQIDEFVSQVHRYLKIDEEEATE